MSFIINRSAFPRIETPDKAAEPILFAAEELRKYLGRILDVKPSAVGKKVAPVIRLLQTPNTDLGEEGFLISMENGELHVRGGSPRAVLYGVYEFLRRFGGCLFSGPAPDGEYIPRQEMIVVNELTVGSFSNKTRLPVRMTPRFWYRALNITGLELNADVLANALGLIDWMAKNGLNYVLFFALPDNAYPDGRRMTIDPQTGEERFDDAGCCTEGWYWEHVVPHIRRRGLLMDMDCHNLLYFLPPEIYFKKHPEWYMLKEGKRIVGAQLTICTSNNDMLAELTKNFLNYVRTHPEMKIVGLSQMDGFGMCECDACRAMDASPNEMFAPLGYFRTPEGQNYCKMRRYVRLINHVARALKKERPDVMIGYSAYYDMNYPPEGTPLEDNVLPKLDVYWNCGAHPLAPTSCANSRFFYNSFIKWRAYHKGPLCVWYPYIHGMGSQQSLPYPISEMICRDMSMLQEIGIGGFVAFSHWLLFKQYNLNFLAFARSCWWHSVDHSKLTDEYLLGVFGKAGRSLRPVYDSFHKSMLRIERDPTDASPYLRFSLAPIDPGGCLMPNGFNVAYFMDELGEKTLDRCIAKARKTAETEREQRQVEAFAAAAGYWKAAAAFFRAYHAALDPLPDVTREDLRGRYRKAKLQAARVCNYIKSSNSQFMGWGPNSWSLKAYNTIARQLEKQLEIN